MERTLVLIKPDGIQRRCIGEIIRRIERKGLAIVALKMFRVQESQARTLYSVHQGKPFYENLVQFITSGPIVAMVVEGFMAIRVMRKLLGATFGYEAESGTIRGDLALSQGMNMVHGSDSAESASREVSIFFRPDEIVVREPIDLSWILEKKERI